MKKIVGLIFIYSLFFQATAQVEADINVFDNKDTTSSIYYTNLTDKLLLKFINSVKYSQLHIRNINDKSVLKLEPAGALDLGLAFNYKWLGLGVSVGLPSGARSDSIKGKSNKYDMQLNIYSKWFVVDGLYQRYKGFYLSNPGSFANWDSTDILPQLPGMENYSMGLSAYYIWNHKKLSYRAAYVRNVIQNKSAGSLLIGPFFNIDRASAPNGFVPDALPSTVKDSFGIDFFSSTSYGLAIGYTYTVVIAKRVFMNFSLVPGIGVKDLKTRLNDVPRASKTGAAARITYRFALGYEHKSFLLGLTLYGTHGNIKIDNFEFSPGAGMLRLFVAKRFDISKKDK